MTYAEKHIKLRTEIRMMSLISTSFNISLLNHMKAKIGDLGRCYLGQKTYVNWRREESQLQEATKRQIIAYKKSAKRHTEKNGI